jgi:cyclohexadienyl dehydratase
MLRVGTSGDYAPFSTTEEAGAFETGDRLEGFGPAIARAYARDRGLELRFVRFRWPELLHDLAADRFDIAMGGITVRPERSIAGVFTLPVATSGAVVLVRDATAGLSAKSELDGLDSPSTRIAVNAGGHLERVARARFPKANLKAIPDNAAVLAALLAGEADAAVTDTMESPHWRSGHPELRELGPFTRDRKAYLLAPSQTARAADMNAWLLANEADGTLARLRTRYLRSDSDRRLSEPLRATLASMDERLALMPLVAEYKRQNRLAIAAPEREARVLDAAVEAIEDAAAARRSQGERVRAVNEEAVRALFRFQIEAAKDIQRRTLGEAPAQLRDPAPDLATELRPALIRIGDRISALLVRLPDDLDEAEVVAATHQELAARGLSSSRLDEIGRALASVTRARGSGVHRPTRDPVSRAHPSIQ